MNTRKTLYTENNELIIGGIKATALAARFGTPLYVMDADYITEVADAYLDAMKEYGCGAVAYTNKTFATVATSKIIEKSGLWQDAVSGGEIYLLKTAGADMSKVLFHGNNKTPKEISEGVKCGVGFFVVDSEPEIYNIQKCAEEYGVKQKVLIRVNPCVAAHTYSAVQTATPAAKFGFGIDDGKAEAAVSAVKACGNLIFKGIHCHIGSQIYDDSAYASAIKIMARFAKKLSDGGANAEVLDIGGGFGIYYTDEDPKFTPKRYAYTLKRIAQEVKAEYAACGMEKPFLIAEPGRSIVGEAGVTLYTVGAVKDFPGIKKYVVVDGGMFENPRCALYDAKYSAVIANKASEPQTDIVTIAGKCCESDDIITENCRLQPAKPGDIAAVFSTGAYNYSMASNYNMNAVPPVVLVKNGKADYIVKPQTYEDMIRNNAVPEWLV